MEISKFVLALVQLSLAFCAGSLDVMMLLHHTPSLENFHGMLSMSSCTVCPCLCISASVSQLASSTGWFFHLTRYSKYCFCLVLLLTFLSSMHSICGLSATGIYFVHWITGCSYPVFSSPDLYGYKSEMLNIGEILIPSGNSISYAFAPNLFKTLHGPIFFIFNLLYVPLGNLSFLKCARTRSPTSN
jgi:hypothetical protein